MKESDLIDEDINEDIREYYTRSLASDYHAALRKVEVARKRLDTQIRWLHGPANGLSLRKIATLTDLSYQTILRVVHSDTKD